MTAAPKQAPARLYTVTVTDSAGELVQTFAGVGDDFRAVYDLAHQAEELGDQIKRVVRADVKGQWPRGAASIEEAEAAIDLARDGVRS